MPPHSAPSDAPPLKILVADDSPTVRTGLRLLLLNLGYVADLVADGAQALTAIRRVRYDAVLMDVQMPVLGGLEAASRLQHESLATERPRIIAISAESSPQDRTRCRDAGMDDFIAKPILAAPLLEALSRCPQRRTLAHEPRDRPAVPAYR